MKLTTSIAAALAALTITGLASTANAAPAPRDGDYVTRAVRSSLNGKDVFVRLVKVPKAQAVAETHDGPMVQDHAAMKGRCERMMGDHRDAAPAPKG